jgi:hypothetical protein
MVIFGVRTHTAAPGWVKYTPGDPSKPCIQRNTSADLTNESHIPSCPTGGLPARMTIRGALGRERVLMHAERGIARRRWISAKRSVNAVVVLLCRKSSPCTYCEDQARGIWSFAVADGYERLLACHTGRVRGRTGPDAARRADCLRRLWPDVAWCRPVSGDVGSQLGSSQTR